MKTSARAHFFGFTLIELLIVIAIVGILTAASIPSFQSFATNQRLSQAAKQVKNDLRSAQNRAINGVKDSSGNKVWGIRFADPNAYSYTIFTCSNLDRTTSPCTCSSISDFKVKSLSSSFSFDTSAGDRFIFDEISGEVCDASGALTGGASSSIGLTLSGSTRTITVTAGGRIMEN